MFGPDTRVTSVRTSVTYVSGLYNLETELLDSLRRQERPFVMVRTKSILAPNVSTERLALSGVNRQGLVALAAACLRTLATSRHASGDLIGTTAARCRESLAHAQQALARVRLAAQSRPGDELLAVELREAVEHLGRIGGAVYTDDILDRIFSRFCIGK